MEQYDIYLKYLMIWYFIGRHILSTAGILFFHLTASQTTKKIDYILLIHSEFGMTFRIDNRTSYGNPFIP